MERYHEQPMTNDELEAIIALEGRQRGVWAEDKTAKVSKRRRSRPVIVIPENEFGDPGDGNDEFVRSRHGRR